jgi:hypothetical protein
MRAMFRCCNDHRRPYGIHFTASPGTREVCRGGAHARVRSCCWFAIGGGVIRAVERVRMERERPSRRYFDAGLGRSALSGVVSWRSPDRETHCDTCVRRRSSGCIVLFQIRATLLAAPKGESEKSGETWRVVAGGGGGNHHA